MGTAVAVAQLFKCHKNKTTWLNSFEKIV